jgi:hypothetical protein
VDFKFIEIMDEKDPYLNLLWIEWDFESSFVIDLKKEMMIFEFYGTYRVVQPLYLYHDPRYIEIVKYVF